MSGWKSSWSPPCHRASGPLSINVPLVVVYQRAMKSAAHSRTGRSGAALLLSVSLSALFALPAHAQVVDTTTRVPPVRADSGKPPAVPTPAGVTAPRPQAQRSSEPLGGAGRKPPITPKRAFLYSLMIPGLGQSRLDRGTAGALFAAVELGSLAMIRKSSVDLRQARRYSGDSLPGNYTVQADGKIVGTGGFGPQFSTDLVNTRRLHTEDWYAAILFNHLLSGADAFVAAQLWNVPRTVALRPYADGIALVATIHW